MGKSEKKMQVRRYSEAFKRHVVQEYEAGASLTALQQKYGIGSIHTVKRWVKRYSREGVRHDVVHIQSPEERDRLKALEEQVRDLERALARLTLEKVRLEEEVALYRELYGEAEVKKNARC